MKKTMIKEGKKKMTKTRKKKNMRMKIALKMEKK